MGFKVRPLHPNFGVVVDNINLDKVSEDYLYPEIRTLFEKHSAILFLNQEFSEDIHIKFSKLFGPLENRDAMAENRSIAFNLPKVSNEDFNGKTFGENHIRTLDLKANMLWHTDSTFLPIPALANIIAAKVLPSSGGQTELASTKLNLSTFPKHLFSRINKRKFSHSLFHSRKKVSPELAKLQKVTRWNSQKWDSIITNPITDEKSIYIASHAYKIEGIPKDESQEIIDEVIAFFTQDKFVYSHEWKLGDVLMWDERAILHRGQPWPYDEARTLNSICISLSPKDGLRNLPKQNFY